MLADCPRTNTNPAIIANAARVRKRSQKAARAFILVVSPVVVSPLGPCDTRCGVRLQVSRVARARHTFLRILQPTCNIHRSPFAHNGSSTSSRVFLFLARRGFDCFPVLCRVSLPIHAHGPVASVQVSLSAVPRTPGVLGGSVPGTKRRHRSGIERNS